MKFISRISFIYPTIFISIVFCHPPPLPPPGMDPINPQPYDQVYHRYGTPGYQHPYYFNFPNQQQQGFVVGNFPGNQLPIYVITATSAPTNKFPVTATTATSTTPIVTPQTNLPSSPVMMTGTTMSPDAIWN